MLSHGSSLDLLDRLESLDNHGWNICLWRYGWNICLRRYDGHSCVCLQSAKSLHLASCSGRLVELGKAWKDRYLGDISMGGGDGEVLDEAKGMLHQLWGVQ